MIKLFHYCEIHIVCIRGSLHELTQKSSIFMLHYNDNEVHLEFLHEGIFFLRRKPSFLSTSQLVHELSFSHLEPKCNLTESSQLNILPAWLSLFHFILNSYSIKIQVVLNKLRTNNFHPISNGKFYLPQDHFLSQSPHSVLTSFSSLHHTSTVLHQLWVKLKHHSQRPELHRRHQLRLLQLLLLLQWRRHQSIKCHLPPLSNKKNFQKRILVRARVSPT